MSDQRQRQQRGAAEAAPRGEPSRAQQRGQRRALYAWNCVAEVQKLGRAVGDRYGTLARKLPSYLQVSGLGQTLAFLFGRGKGNESKAEALLLKHLGSHLNEQLKRPATQDPMETLLTLSAAEYRQATREAMALAEWLKRFAEGKLGEEDR